MATLRDLARDGRTVVASIHQPRSSIFAMFDDLVLLSEGAAVYAGPADGALKFFAEQARPWPWMQRALWVEDDILAPRCSESF